MPWRLRDPVRGADRRHVVRAQDHREHDAHGCDHEGCEESPTEVVDPEHPFGDGVRDEEDRGVRDQHQQEAEHERERQPQRSNHRRDHRVQRRDDRSDEQSAPEVVDVDARQDPRGHHQGDARCEPRGEQREQPELRALGLPGRGVAVGQLGVARHQARLLRRDGGASFPVSRPRRSRPRPDSARSAFFFALLSACWAFCSATLTFASAYDCVTSCLPPRQPKTQTTSTSARRTFQAVVISCCAVE